MTDLLERAEAMAERLELIRGYFNASSTEGQTLCEAQSLIRELIAQVKAGEV
jgi:hypothetical protein